MGFTGTALEQRGREARALKTFLALSLIGSLGLHLSVLASGIVNHFLKRAQETDEEPIEFVVMDTPAPKPVAKPIEPVKPLQEAPKPKIVEPIKPQPVEPPKPVLPQKTVVVPQKPLEPLPPVLPKQTVIVPRKPPVQPQKIVTPPVEKPIPKPQPKIPQPTNTQSKPEPAPKPQSNENLKQTLRDLQNSKASQGGGGGGGNTLPVATGSGDGTVRTGTGTGTGIGTGSGSGVGSGIGSGTGSGIGSGTGSGIGSGIGSGQGSGKTEVATAPKPRIAAPSQLNFADCVKCDVKYPERAKRRGIEGRPGVAFDVDNNGNVNNVRLVRSSGHKELDEALLKQARDFKLNSAAAGRQNVQLFANFAIAGSRNNQEALQRQRERQEANRQAEQRNREAAVNEEETSGRRRRAILTTPEAAPQSTPETGTRRRRDIPSAATESTTEQTTPQPVPQLPEQNSSFEQNGQQPPDASTNQNGLREQLRLRQNQSQPSEAAPSGTGENNE